MRAMILMAAGMTLAAQTPSIKTGTFQAQSRMFYTTENGLPSNDVTDVRISASGEVTAVTSKGSVTLTGGQWTAAKPAPAKSAIAVAKDGRKAEARPAGLFVAKGKNWERAYPSDGKRSWAPVDVRGVAFDAKNRLWFASPQGAGVQEDADNGKWTLYTGAEGLPYDDFTCVAAGEGGEVWFGTKIGAIRFDGKVWEYRQGLRWLPADEVRAIAVASNGDAWIATPAGLAVIQRKPMTLMSKANWFEAEIDKRHRRTPYQYVHPVVLKKPGDVSQYTQVDSDNDGLWTSMYGAGECFAYGATGSAESQKRARQAFEALRFLGTVTQGGAHPAPRGFVARSILPTSGRNPNDHDNAARDRVNQAQRDHRWKIFEPRWPVSADGQWYWKTDTSSDELDGHYFFYALYYDLVAKNEDDKKAVRDHVAALTDHLLVHNFTLVDHDSTPTRWAIFNPESLNEGKDFWQERGMNSISILAYLKVAEHITGDKKYAEAYDRLIRQHDYAANAMIIKTHLGPGAGNQSDDEMIFMNYYSLLKYEKDPDLREKYLMGFYCHYQNEQPELNPLFNFMYAAMAQGGKFHDAYGEEDLTARGPWLEESLDSLQRLPMDRIDWGVKNSHRKDIVPLAPHVREGGARQTGYRVNGKVLPIDERYVGHWNHDPWALDYRGAGRSLGDGAIYLLPYYMGLYHGFLRE